MPPSDVKLGIAILVAPRDIWSEEKEIVESVAPALNVQVKPDPEPKVASVISVVSRFRVIVSVAPATVSIPLVPPATVTVSESLIVCVVPESPASEKVVIPTPPPVSSCSQVSVLVQAFTVLSVSLKYISPAVQVDGSPVEP